MVSFSVAALDDLDDIYDFHFARNPRYAEKLSTRLRDAARSLSDFPERGASIPDATSPLRWVLESGHAILYETSESGVTIARILHGSRDIAAIVADMA